MAIEVKIHGVGEGTCTLTGKQADGLTVTFADGTVVNGFLSHKSFQQLFADVEAKRDSLVAATS